MADYLASLPEPRVAGWYKRLADLIANQKVDGQVPLASIFLQHWLDNRNPQSTFSFTAPKYLRESSYVIEGLKHQRKVFLTEERARRGRSAGVWGGVIPRLQDGRWTLPAALNMEYECLIEVGSGYVDIARIQVKGTPAEKDLLTSLRGFQLKSEVTVTGAKLSSGKIKVTFTSWQTSVKDRYDWDYTEHFTVPNPDFGSAIPDAVRPKDEKLTVYHSNAKRLEDAKLAAPYDVKSDVWTITDTNIMGPAEVDPSRKL